MARRRLRERRTIIVRLYTLLGILIFSVLIGGLVYGMWRPEVRVTDISVSGTQVLLPQEIGQVVQDVIAGSFFYVLPRDNVFLLPKKQIQKKLEEVFPRIETVSTTQTGLKSIELSVLERDPVAYWCSSATGTPCFVSDREGFLFATRAQEEGFVVSGPLAKEDVALRNTIFKEGAFENVYSLALAISETNGKVVSIQFRNPDEVILTLAVGPRIEYVLGEEEYVAEALPSVFADIDDLAAIEYIDMRFGKRVYIKRNE